MTNTPSGSNKRPLEGSSRYDAEYQNKRPRERERDEPKDWREVHLRSPRSAGKQPSGSKREEGGADRRDYGRRDADYRRAADSGRGRDRRDDRDRDRDRDYHSRRDSSRKRSPHSARDHRSPALSNGHLKDDSEKEEGE